MGEHNRRQSARVPCDLPIRLCGHDGEYTGQIVDLSRSGLRLRLPGASLGVHRLSSLVQVTRSLHAALGDAFAGDLHFEQLGPLVQRTLVPCRIAKRDWERTDVEIGCEFDRPLTQEEVGMLGVSLPEFVAEPPSEAAADAQAAAEPTRPHLREDDPEHAATAYLYPAPGKNAKPLVTHTCSLTRGMAILEVERGQGWDLPHMAVSDIVGALDRAYGTAVLLRVVDGDDDLWTGPAEVKEIDVAPTSRVLRLGVAFGRELRTEELGRLGLPTPA